MHFVVNSIEILKSLILVSLHCCLFTLLHKSLLCVWDSGQSVWFEKAVDTFTSGGSGQSLHL